MLCIGIAEDTAIDDIVDVDATAQRPLEVMDLVADESEAERLLGWRPMTSFDTMVERMVSNDIQELLCK
jgi:GDP-D-mannose dehydratase